jgi:hypothetical protein
LTAVAQNRTASTATGYRRYTLPLMSLVAGEAALQLGMAELVHSSGLSQDAAVGVGVGEEGHEPPWQAP